MEKPVTTRRAAQKAKIQTRSMQNSERKPNAALLEAKRKAKLRMNQKNPDPIVKDIYSTAMTSIGMIRKDTGLIYDRRMAMHYCLWDDNYPECPERFTRILMRCEELDLIDRCSSLQPRSGTKEEVLLKHTIQQYEMLEKTSGSKNDDELEELSSNFDAIYIHPTTFDLSLLSVGSTIELLDNIIDGTVQNGMAIIRPPGHHAMKAEYNGYCFFNNVAIAAQHALNNRGVGKILIVDWDVHHGQGTQQMFYDDPKVLYFSIHRFEFGTFWPNLRESDFDFIGEGEGRGFNFNIPLNKIGMTNSDYLAIWHQILLPVACEFQPDLVIISAGYDAAFGCPEGEMEITPACYSHLLSPLLALAEGKVAVVLEGGYCLESLSESTALTLKTLLGDPCPLMENLDEPCDTIQEVILNSVYVHKEFWNCLQLQDVYSLEDLNNVNPPQPDLHKIVQIFKDGPPKPSKFDTRDCYPIQSEQFLTFVSDRLNHLRITTNLNFPANRVCYVYDESMMEHKHEAADGYPERPERIKKIADRLEEYKLLERMLKLTTRQATTDELCLAHTRSHVNFIRKTVEKENHREIGDTFNSVYFHPSTFQCAITAAGSLLQVVDNVLNGTSRSGIAVVRPPGHHAESDMPHGFCIFNNVAIAANYAIRDHGLKRVLIIDWDVHHGNGIQHIFQNNNKVLYISLHRYDNGSFFPKSTDGDYTVVGDGPGEGFNVNIPWNKKGMSDMEYIAAFQNIILPISSEFNPELVLVSAGFDAAIGDPLGGCKVSPEAYAYFTHWLSSLANGRIILCLEGGYNVNSISYAMTMCTKALLGDPLPIVQTNRNGLSESCIETLRNVNSVHQKYWKCLKFNKKLPDFNKIHCATDEITENMNEMKIVDSDENKQSSGSNSTNKSLMSEAGPSKSTGETPKQTLGDYLSDNMEALVNGEMFAVVPLKNCPHLSTLDINKTPSSINTKTKCEDCSSEAENWICLHCFKVYCGRYIQEHMSNHHHVVTEREHTLTLSFSDLSVWCYKCEDYIDNSALFKYQNLAHLDKFGEEMVWSYGNDLVLLEE